MKEVLEEYKEGQITLDEALHKLKNYKDLGFAKIDTHRKKRKGFPEVIFCQGKTPEQVVNIISNMTETVLGTRADKNTADMVVSRFPGAIYNETARTIVIEKEKKQKKGCIAVVSAGTADMPVAEEAAITAEVMGNNVKRFFDVGVAGIHRLMHNIEEINNANVIIVVAGMEGALASVVGGLVSKPVIAVPTSIGYGAAFNGIAPLLTMLNSCAPGVAVMNIDNGFGAGYFAGMINNDSVL